MMSEPRWYEIPFVVLWNWILSKIFFIVYKLPYSETGLKIMAWCIKEEKYPDWPEPESK
jgi:hypothetical protein